MLANLRDLGRLAGWPVGRLAGLAAALLVAVVLALLCHSRTPPPLVGDFPTVERSSRGLALAMLPHVAALVAPSARVRTRANRGTRQGLSQALRQSRVSAWFPARRSPLRYGLPRQPWPVPAPTARALAGPLASERQPPERAACLLVASAQSRCRNPGTRETARAQKLFSRRYQCVGRAPACARSKTPCSHRKALPMMRRYQSSSVPVLALGERASQGTEDFDGHGPRPQVAHRRKRPPLGAAHWWKC
jgi:hypothetical protein